MILFDTFSSKENTFYIYECISFEMALYDWPLLQNYEVFEIALREGGYFRNTKQIFTHQIMTFFGPKEYIVT